MEDFLQHQDVNDLMPLLNPVGETNQSDVPCQESEPAPLVESNTEDHDGQLEKILCFPDLLFANLSEEEEQEVALDLSPGSGREDSNNDQDSCDPDVEDEKNNQDEDHEIANLVQCLTNIKAWNDPEKAVEKQRLLMCHYRKGQRLGKQVVKLRERDLKRATKQKQSLEIIKRQKIVIRGLEKTLKDLLIGQQC
jgi:hypothetical protein